MSNNNHAFFMKSEREVSDFFKSLLEQRSHVSVEPAISSFVRLIKRQVRVIDRCNGALEREGIFRYLSRRCFNYAIMINHRLVVCESPRPRLDNDKKDDIALSSS